MDKKPDAPPHSYNVNLYDLEPEYDAWFEEQGIPVRYFVDMDGGGANYFTIEFQTREHAVGFIRHFGFRGEPYPWGEKKKNEGWQPYNFKGQLTAGGGSRHFHMRKIGQCSRISANKTRKDRLLMSRIAPTIGSYFYFLMSRISAINGS